MAARLVKCYGTCGLKYPQEQMKKLSGANHCPSCYESKEKDIADREELYNFLKSYFNLNFPTGLMLRQIKQYREERSYTYKNIRFALDYMIRIKKIDLNLQYGIALVPHYYDEMIAYYKDLKERREKTQVVKVKTITVQKKPRNLENTYRQKKLINMEELLK
jgi:hypothetical protein